MNPITHTKLLALSTFSLAMVALSANAATWTGTIDSDIGDASNWNPIGLPNNTGTNDGIINNGDTVLMENRLDLNGQNLIVSGNSTIFLDADFATLYSTNGGFRWGGASTLTLLDGGHLDIDITDSTNIGRGGDATLNMYAGSTVDFVGSVGLGRDGVAAVNQFGGSFVTGGTLSIQENAGGVASGQIYHLSGGTVTAGNLIVNDRNFDNSNYFNFTTGSTGTLTITQSSFDFEGFIDDGEIRLNDNASSDFADFVVTTGSTEGTDWTRLALVPEPGTYALLAGLSALTAIMLRRRSRVA